MALLLHIDSALNEAVVCLAEKNEILAEQTHSDQKSHASFLQVGILNILKNSGKQLEELDGVSVSAGPGSYTGLRVGLASAKGICYTLNKPLILLNTLEILAEKAKCIQESPENSLYCPMIDARRMEVFTALYDDKFKALLNPGAYLLDDPSFVNNIVHRDKRIVFLGSGMSKWQSVCPEGNFSFEHVLAGGMAQNHLAQAYFEQKRFSDVAYSEPLYFKSFYTTAKI